ncbi:YjjW family glycine radical enzyme activase [Lachnospiraceae bacterium M18-1]|nr:YjjW family glycine radical enzyme activase [Lachnospiraceae bacterium M18-1]
MAVINKIIHSSVVDGPGNRAVIFLQGCNYQCLYCHNPETIGTCTLCGACIGHCPAGALRIYNGAMQWSEKICCGCDSCIQICPHLSSPRTKDYSAKQVMDAISGDIPFIRGITVSGGECSLQRDFVLELFRLAKEQKLSALADSNGSYDYTRDEELLQVCDGVMLDVKAFDQEAHMKLTGKDNKMVLKNAVFLAECGKLEEIRTVIVPDCLPNEDTVDRITKLLKPYLKERSIRYKLIAYRKFGVRPPYNDILRIPKPSEMERYKRIAENNGFDDVVII